jgi:hypothetical protein
VEALDRYLQAVGSWLPKGQQADIVAELSEDLRSEIEEKERALGHRLDEADLFDLLERRGHPMWVAEAYLPKRHLIGPAVLPFYWRALKIAIPCILAVFVVLFLVFARVVKNPPPALAHPGFWVWQLGLWTFAYVGLFTLIFALVERSQARARATGHWDPRDPGALPTVPTDPETRARQELRFNAIADAVANLLVLSWWLDVHPVAMPELGIVLTPVWQILHWPIAALLGASVAVGLANAFRPSWSRPRLIARLLVDGLALALTVTLLSAGPWVDVTSPGIPAAAAAAIEKWMNLSWLVALLVTALIYAVRTIQHARRLAGRRPIREPDHETRHGGLK